MADTYTWDSYVLAIDEDVEDEIEDLEMPFQTAKNADLKSIVERRHKVVKELIGQQIDLRLPQIFASTVGRPITWDQWVMDQGYSYEDLDSIKDKLKNPQVLKRAAVAGIIVAMLRNGSLINRMKNEDNSEVVADPLKDWKGEYQTRLNDAINSLKLDLDGDGKSNDLERVGPRRNTIERV